MGLKYSIMYQCVATKLKPGMIQLGVMATGWLGLSAQRGLVLNVFNKLHQIADAGLRVNHVKHSFIFLGCGFGLMNNG